MPAIPEFELRWNAILSKTGLIDTFLRNGGEFLGNGWDELFADAKQLLRAENDGLLRGILIKQVFLRQGEIYYNSGDYEAALQNFTTLIDMFPDYQDAYYARGLCFYDLELFDEAIGEFTQAIELYSECSDFYHQRGNALKEKGEDLEKVMADYNRAIEINPDNPEFYYSRGCLKLETGDYKDALGDFDNAIEDGYINSMSLFWRALTKVNLEDFNGAIEDADLALRLDEKNLEARALRAELLFNLRRIDEAFIDYSEIAKKNPMFHLPWYKLAMIEFEKENYKEALKNISFAITMNISEASYYNLKGKIYLNLENNVKAASEFKKALKYKPGDPELMCNLAEAYIRNGKLIIAAETLAKVKKSHCGYPEANYLDAYIFFLTGNHESAIKYCSKTLQSKPEHYKALYLRGISKLNIEDMKGAEEDLTQALKIYSPEGDIAHQVRLIIENEKPPRKA